MPSNAFIQRLSDPRVAPRKADCRLFVSELVKRQEPAKKLFGSARPRIAAVYGLIDDVDVFYIGKSVNVYSRMKEQHHWRGGFDAFGYVPIPEADLELVEFRLIRWLQPVGNGTYKKPRVTWGMMPVDDIADVLNVSPAEVLAVRDAHEMPMYGLNLDLREILWHFSRR